MSKRRLSLQQQRRISKKHHLDQELNADTATLSMGLVIARFSKQAKILELSDGDGDQHIFRCHIRANILDLVAGDMVRWQPGAPTGVVVAVMPRKSLMSRPDSNGKLRPLAANVSQIAIVIAPEPAPHQNLVDRYLVAIEHLGIQPLLVINKTDLVGEHTEHLERLKALYQGLGYPVIAVSTKHNRGLDQLRSALDGESTVFVGQSGVGKSSLVNLICPEAGAAVSALSLADKGRHTTTNANLYTLDSGGYLIDSPGIREFGLWHMEPAEVAAGFIEFRPFLGQCKFRNCRHLDEPGCAILEASGDKAISGSRITSYQQIVKELNQR